MYKLVPHILHGGQVLGIVPLGTHKPPEAYIILQQARKWYIVGKDHKPIPTLTQHYTNQYLALHAYIQHKQSHQTTITYR